MKMARSGQPSFCIALALVARMLWRDTPRMEVVRKGARLDGTSSSSAASEQQSAPVRLRPWVRSSTE